MRLDRLFADFQKHSYWIGSSFLRAYLANDYGESCGFYCSSNVKKQIKELNRFLLFNKVKFIDKDAVAD